ncbi:cytochrome P450 [Azotobacter salinestris]|uniref:cytochrome P450 n=1 Tax=Azotobacter salinestris TaxID=69964 RepID=UPI0032DFE6AC
MHRIPRDKGLDSTLALLHDPYRFIARRCRLHGSDLFETRLLLQKTLCISGAEAARLFCEPERFVRQGAMPRRLQNSLFGVGGVQELDGDAHLHRKRMFVALLMDPARVARLVEAVRSEWRTCARRWATLEKVVLYDALQDMLTRAVCAWGGIPLGAEEAGQRAHEVALMFDYAGSVGPKHWRSRLARRRSEAWMETIVDAIRAGRLHPPAETAAHVIAWHHGPDGRLLELRVAAVELLSVIRPFVAIAVYLTFVAHALHRHPQCRHGLQSGDAEYAEWFVQEVRRFYPFFPAVIARVRQDFDWQGYGFPAGRRVMLDLYGTNHDARIWQAPEEFRPERFATWDHNPYNFIPQGGGDHERNHRCPGERIVIEVMKLGADVLARQLSYEVPAQDLDIDFSRLPALPRSRFVMTGIRGEI